MSVGLTTAQAGKEIVRQIELRKMEFSCAEIALHGARTDAQRAQPRTPSIELDGSIFGSKRAPRASVVANVSRLRVRPCDADGFGGRAQRSLLIRVHPECRTKDDRWWSRTEGSNRAVWHTLGCR
jgi:hypothetical protein